MGVRRKRISKSNSVSKLWGWKVGRAKQTELELVYMFSEREIKNAASAAKEKWRLRHLRDGARWGDGKYKTPT